MCGIVGYIGPKVATPMLIERLSKLRDTLRERLGIGHRLAWIY